MIVEPVAGSTGVLLPPKGYLQKLREICTKHGILLIFDEVITGFGRLGASFATEYFGVVPDMITCAKGLTNGTVPMGAVFARKGIYDTFMEKAPENAIELFHGYTYSAHPLACAAALASLEIYQEEGLFERCASAGRLLGGRGALPEGRAQRHRPAQSRPDRRHRAGVGARQGRASAPSKPSSNATRTAC